MNEQEAKNLADEELLAVPRIEYLQVKNYRVLQNLELKGLTPLTVFLGPNGERQVHSLRCVCVSFGML